MNSTVKCIPLPIAMRHSALVVSMTAALSLGFAAHAHAATAASVAAKPGAPTPFARTLPTAQRNTEQLASEC